MYVASVIFLVAVTKTMTQSDLQKEEFVDGSRGMSPSRRGSHRCERSYLKASVKEGLNTGSGVQL